MDPINQNQPVPPAAPQNTDGEQGKKVGPIVATLVIVLVLIFAALYLFAAKVSQHNAAQDINDPTVSSTTSVERVKPVTNTDDDLQSIQADLNASATGVDQQNF